MANFTPVGVELVVRGAGKFNSTLGKAQGSIAGFGKAAVKAAALGAAAVGAAAVGIGVASVKMAVSFESAFAGVIKTTDGLVDEFGNLTDVGKEMQKGFRDLSKEIPVTVEELLAIGEIGGQLGIAQEDLVDFTRTIADMGEASNLSTEEAAVGFAQLASIMQTPQEEIKNMASAVVELGNNLETNERDVLSFAQRLAGAGAVAGVTEADIFGISAAFTSVGIGAQAGGTAVSKVFLDINQAVIEGGEKMEIFARVAGIEAGNFGTAWEEDAGAVFGEFVKGLGLAGDDAVAILDALEIKDSQAIRAFLSLAGAGDKVTDAMELSSDAYIKNTALTKEAEARYRTTESQFKIFKNTIKDIGITIGQALLPALNSILKAARPLITEFGKRLPKAIEAVTKLWNKTLLPALEKFSKFVNDNIIPAIRTLIDWLGDNFKPVLVVVGAVVVAVFAAWAISAAAAAVATIAALAPIAIPLLAIGAAAFLLKKVWDENFGGIQEKTKVVIDALAGFFNDILKPIIDEISAFIMEMFGKVVDWVEENWPLIQEAISDTMGTISAIVGKVLGAITDFWQSHGKEIMEFVKDAWGFIKKLIDTTVNVILGIIKAVLQVISGDWEGAWETIKNITEDVWMRISDTIENWINTAKDIIERVVSGVKSWLSDRWDDIKAKVAETWDAIKTKIFDVWETIKGIIELKINAIKTDLQTKMDEIKTNIVTKWEEIKQAISDKWEEIKETIRTKIGDIIQNIKDAGQRFFDAGVGIVNRLWDGLKSKIAEVIAWFRSKIEEITNMFPWSSPPKDPTSPLQGLSRSGELFWDEWMQGARKGYAKAQSQLSGMLGTLGPQMTAAPASAMGSAGSTTNNNDFSFHPTINNEMDMVSFEQRVRRVVTDAVTD